MGTQVGSGTQQSSVPWFQQSPGSIGCCTLQKVAVADLAETANQRCLSSKVKPAQVSMAGEAYQCCRPSTATVVRRHLSAPNAHTIASEPRVRR